MKGRTKPHLRLHCRERLGRLVWKVVVLNGVQFTGWAKAPHTAIRNAKHFKSVIWSTHE